MEAASENSWNVVVNAPGKFSIYNSLAAISVAEQYQIPEEAIEKALTYPAGAGTHRNASGIATFYRHRGLCAQCHGTGCVAEDAAGLSPGADYLYFRLWRKPGGRTQISNGRSGRAAGRSGGGDHG